MSTDKIVSKSAMQNAPSSGSAIQTPPQEAGPTTRDAEPSQACSKILARVYGLVDYLYWCVEGGLVTQQLAHLAWDAWKALSAATRDTLPVPNACPGPDGQLLYTWDLGEHHLELEVFPEGPSEFFYRNRTSGELWECEYAVEEPVPGDALAKLKLFV